MVRDLLSMCVPGSNDEIENLKGNLNNVVIQ